MIHEKKFDKVEVYSQGYVGARILAIFVDLITRLEYCTVVRIKTKGCDRGGVKLIVHLSPTEKFEELYQNFEKVKEDRRRGLPKNSEQERNPIKILDEHHSKEGEEDKEDTQDGEWRTDEDGSHEEEVKLSHQEEPELKEAEIKEGEVINGQEELPKQEDGE